MDDTFRRILIAGCLAVVLVVLPRRIASQSTGEPLDRLQEGLFILVTLRVAALALWLGVIAYMIDPTWMAWSSMPLPVWMRWTGVGVLAVVVALLTWTLRSLGRNLTDTVVTRRAHTLVTHGPYRWVRHPFYDAMALLILAMSLVAANWYVLLTGIVVLSLIVVRTRTEEEKLLARFGEPYQAYLRHTGRFLPRRLNPEP